jgi:hypothetical protein
MKQMVAGISIVLVAIGIVAAASALQNPYPMDGYVTDNAGATVSGATVTFTNQNTGEAIYDDTQASGWYSNDAGNFPSGYHDGNVIQYCAVFGEYTNTTTHTIDIPAGSHTMNITLDVILDSDADGVPDAWDTEPNTPIAYWTDSQGRGRMLGDMNGDGKLSSVDALMILQQAVK